MTRTQALAYFGGTHEALAQALKISRPAVTQWGETIPEVRQYQIRAITEGQLELDANLLSGLGADISRNIPLDAPKAPAPSL